MDDTQAAAEARGIALAAMMLHHMVFAALLGSKAITARQAKDMIDGVMLTLDEMAGEAGSETAAQAGRAHALALLQRLEASVPAMALLRAVDRLPPGTLG